MKWWVYGATSAVWTLIPSVSAVWGTIAQFAHVDAQLCPSTLELIGWASRRGAVLTWRKTNRDKVSIQSNFIYPRRAIPFKVQTVAYSKNKINKGKWRLRRLLRNNILQLTSKQHNTQNLSFFRYLCRLKCSTSKLEEWKNLQTLVKFDLKLWFLTFVLVVLGHVEHFVTSSVTVK